MPRETIYLPNDQEYPQRMSAELLAVVAYPNDTAKRRRFALAAGSYILRRRAEDDFDWAWSPQLVTPAVLVCDPQQSKKHIDHCLRTLETRRMPAARMAKILLADELVKDFDPKQLGRAVSKAIGVPIESAQLKLTVPIDAFDAHRERNISEPHHVSVN